MTGDLPVAGDWDGNGTTTVGGYRPSTNTFYQTNDLKSGTPAGTAYGLAGDQPVVINGQP